MSQNIVESVVVHLVSDLLDHLLTGSYDVSVHNVGLFILEYSEFDFGIKYEGFVGALLPSRDVLDTEAV